jgi:DNA polymerase III subunit epsilon
VGVVIVEHSRIVDRLHTLIRPPSREFVFSHIHGVSWDDVKDSQRRDAVWAELAHEFEGVEFLAAHNAPVDTGVLGACCEASGLAAPEQPLVCTVRRARGTWDICPTRLPDVCRYLGIDLRHHEPDSDAEAGSPIVMAAGKGGWAMDRAWACLAEAATIHRYFIYLDSLVKVVLEIYESMDTEVSRLIALPRPMAGWIV